MKIRPFALVVGCLLVLARSGFAQGVTYAGEALVAQVKALGVNVSVQDTGVLPSAGGSLSTELASVSVPNLVDLHLLSANTVGENNQTNSDASVTDVTITAAGVNITASVLTSNATATCTPALSGSSTIAALKVNGVSVRATGAPNQTIPLLLGSLVINEQISSIVNTPTFTSADMLVNALHLKIGGIADVVISSSHAAVACPNEAPQ
ncbi:MAG TPA: choice-of-anchor P family protein [Bryobacteraceae bacterium]|nr:choice-of-anchor P family protein [Bryobacteraceae bacterium]